MFGLNCSYVCVCAFHVLFLFDPHTHHIAFQIDECDVMVSLTMEHFIVEWFRDLWNARYTQ